MNRPECLDAAYAAITGQREQDYGSPGDNFTRVALMWTAVLGVTVSAADVALCLICLKVARLSVNPSHADSWIDAAGYAACGAEVATKP